MDIYDKSEDEFLEWLQSQINDEEEGISDTDQLDNLYTFISNRIIRRKKTHKKLLKWAFWDENLFDSNE